MGSYGFGDGIESYTRLVLLALSSLFFFFLRTVWEADEVARSIASGRLESKRMPHAESILMMKVESSLENPFLDL
jgi:hypothetical protein